MGKKKGVIWLGWWWWGHTVPDFPIEKPFPLFLVTLPLGVFDKLFTYQASQC